MSAAAAEAFVTFLGGIAERRAVLDDHVQEQLRAEGVLVPVAAGPGRWVGMIRYMYTVAIVEGRIGSARSHDRRWCYHNAAAAFDGFNGWLLAGFEGEPTGWHRSPYDGRRRTNGDPAREYLDGEIAR